MKGRKTQDALEIMDRELFEGKPGVQAELEAAREGAQVAQALFDMRQEAGLSQRELARRAGTTASVISRLENADYEGHSVRLLRRLAAVMDFNVEVRFRRRKPGQDRLVAVR